MLEMNLDINSYQKLDFYIKALAENPLFAAIFVKTVVPELQQMDLPTIIKQYIQLNEHNKVLYMTEPTDQKPVFSDMERRGVISKSTQPKIKENEVFTESDKLGKSESISSTEGITFNDIVYMLNLKRKEGPCWALAHLDLQQFRLNPFATVNRPLYFASQLITMQEGMAFSKKYFDGIHPVYSCWLYFDYPDHKPQNSMRLDNRQSTNLVSDFGSGQLPRPVKGSGLAKGTLPNTVSKVCSSSVWS